MKTFLNMLAVSLYRAVVSVRFCLCAAGVALALLLATLGLIEIAPDVLYLLQLGFGGSGSFILIVCVLPILPFATSFASEWQERAATFWITRTGTRNYAVCKFLAGVLSGALATAAGIALYVLIMSIGKPLFTQCTSGDVYTPYLLTGRPVLYLVCFIVHVSLSSALFAAAAAWISAWIPHPLTAAAAPAVLYLLLLRFSTLPAWPDFLKPAPLVEGLSGTGAPSAALLTKLGIVAALCLLMGYGMAGRVRGRVLS